MSSDPDFAAVERHREAVTEQFGDERPDQDDRQDVCAICDRIIEPAARYRTATGEPVHMLCYEQRFDQPTEDVT